MSVRHCFALHRHSLLVICNRTYAGSDRRLNYRLFSADKARVSPVDQAGRQGCQNVQFIEMFV